MARRSSSLRRGGSSYWARARASFAPRSSTEPTESSTTAPSATTGRASPACAAGARSWGCGTGGGSARVSRERDELHLVPRHLREPPFLPVAFGLLDPLERARYEVPPDVALA